MLDEWYVLIVLLGVSVAASEIMNFVCKADHGFSKYPREQEYQRKWISLTC